MQSIKEAQIQTLLKELIVQPELKTSSNLISQTNNEVANLLLKVSSTIRNKKNVDGLLDEVVRLIGELGIAERVLLFQLDTTNTKAYLTNYWESSYTQTFNPVGFKIDLKDPPFNLFQSTLSSTVQIESLLKYYSLPNYIFNNKYKALFLKLKTKSMLLALGSSEKIKVALSLQFTTQEVVWSNEVEKALQSVVDQLAIALEKFAEEKKKEKLEKRFAKLEEKTLLEKEELLRRFASDVHDLPCSIIPALKQAITRRDFTESEKLVDELNLSLRQLINEYIVPEVNLLGFLNTLYQIVNGFKKAFKGKVSFDLPEEEINLSYRKAIELLKVVKEWFCNIEKHSCATEVNFTVEKLNDLRFSISIDDNGKGFDLEQARAYGYGISNIERRLKSIEAKFLIKSAIGKGANLKIQMAID